VHTDLKPGLASFVIINNQRPMNTAKLSAARFHVIIQGTNNAIFLSGDTGATLNSYFLY